MNCVLEANYSPLKMIRDRTHTDEKHADTLTMRIKIPLHFKTSALGLCMQLVVSMTVQERFQNPTVHNIAYATGR